MVLNKDYMARVQTAKVLFYEPRGVSGEEEGMSILVPAINLPQRTRPPWQHLKDGDTWLERVIIPSMRERLKCAWHM